MQRVDGREAPSTDASDRPLTQHTVEQHYTDVGVDIHL